MEFIFNYIYDFFLCFNYILFLPIIIFLNLELSFKSYGKYPPILDVFISQNADYDLMSLDILYYNVLLNIS